MRASLPSALLRLPLARMHVLPRYVLITRAARSHRAHFFFPDETSLANPEGGYARLERPRGRKEGKRRSRTRRYPELVCSEKKGMVYRDLTRSDRIVGQATRLALPGSAVSPTGGPPPTHPPLSFTPSLSLSLSLPHSLSLSRFLAASLSSVRRDNRHPAFPRRTNASSPAEKAHLSTPPDAAPFSLSPSHPSPPLQRLSEQLRAQARAPLLSL